MIYERYYECHNEWIEIKPRGWIAFLVPDVEHKGYLYYKPLNGLKYRKKLKQ